MGVVPVGLSCRRLLRGGVESVVWFVGDFPIGSHLEGDPVIVGSSGADEILHEPWRLTLSPGSNMVQSPTGAGAVGTDFVGEGFESHVPSLLS